MEEVFRWHNVETGEICKDLFHVIKSTSFDIKADRAIRKWMLAWKYNKKGW